MVWNIESEKGRRRKGLKTPTNQFFLNWLLKRLFNSKSKDIFIRSDKAYVSLDDKPNIRLNCSINLDHNLNFNNYVQRISSTNINLLLFQFKQ